MLMFTTLLTLFSVQEDSAVAKSESPMPSIEILCEMNQFPPNNDETTTPHTLTEDAAEEIDMQSSSESEK
jgi:hypothetical protein